MYVAGSTFHCCSIHHPGGHLDVVRLLVDQAADVDSQDNRKVSCLMAAFRKVRIQPTYMYAMYVHVAVEDHHSCDCI